MSAPAIDQSRTPRLGDRIRTVMFPHLTGRIIEFRGPLGRNGTELYGMEIDFSDHTGYTELPREEFEYLDDGNDPDHPNPPAAPATE